MRLQTLKYAILSLLAVPAAFASTATLATLNANGIDTVGAYTFTVSGASNNQLFCNCFDVNEPGTYTSATVSNMPAPGAPIIQITGDNFVTLTFNNPVSGLLLYEFSLGGGPNVSTYTFNATPTVLSQGPNGLYTEYNGGDFTLSGNSITGDEANGTIEFAGPIQTLTINVSNGEDYNGFEVGLLPQTAATPEPESLVMVGTGLVGLAGLVRRRMSR